MDSDSLMDRRHVLSAAAGCWTCDPTRPHVASAVCVLLPRTDRVTLLEFPYNGGGGGVFLISQPKNSCHV